MELISSPETPRSHNLNSPCLVIKMLEGLISIRRQLSPLCPLLLYSHLFFITSMDHIVRVQMNQPHAYLQRKEKRFSNKKIDRCTPALYFYRFSQFCQDGFTDDGLHCPSSFVDILQTSTFTVFHADSDCCITVIKEGTIKSYNVRRATGP